MERSEERFDERCNTGVDDSPLLERSDERFDERCNTGVDDSPLLERSEERFDRGFMKDIIQGLMIILYWKGPIEGFKKQGTIVL